LKTPAYSLRSSTFVTFPIALRGSSFTNTTAFGEPKHQKGADGFRSTPRVSTFIRDTMGDFLGDKRIGALIYAAREKAKLTQAELADRAGMHSEPISNLERGTTLPNIATLIELARAFDLPEQELIPVEPTGSKKASRRRLRLEAEIRELLRDLSETNLEVARDHIAIVACWK
jgi:transcriptional regulator with XRE-family HTH domain